jgi:hypothetical protein
MVTFLISLRGRKRGLAPFSATFLKYPVDLGKKVPVPFFLTAPHKKTQHAPV